MLKLQRAHLEVVLLTQLLVFELVALQMMLCSHQMLELQIAHGLLNRLQRSLSSLHRGLSSVCRSLSSLSRDLSSLRCCRCVTGTTCGQRQRSVTSRKAVA